MTGPVWDAGHLQLTDNPHLDIPIANRAYHGLLRRVWLSPDGPLVD